MPDSPNPQPAPSGSGDISSIISYVETFLGIVEAGTTAEVHAFWVQTIRNELQTVAAPSIRTEALRLLQEVEKTAYWFAHEAERPGEALPLICSPIRRLLEYLRQAAPRK
jgi:hypothetical protein